MDVFTVGYEGCEIEDFVSFLKKSKIAKIVDTRKDPVSRKRGFSKKKLAEQLAARNISYVHYPALGMPREWRQKAKAGDITRAKMFSMYEKKVLPNCESEISDLLAQAAKSRIALLCFEADPDDCHRKWIARQMKEKRRTVTIVDLRPCEEPRRVEAAGGNRRDPHTRERIRE